MAAPHRPPRAARRLPPDPVLFEGGGWRYRVGGTQALMERLALDAKVAFVAAPDTGKSASWNLALTRHFEPGGSASPALYGIEGLGVDGLGGLLSAYVPLPGNSWSSRAPPGSAPSTRTPHRRSR